MRNVILFVLAFLITLPVAGLNVFAADSVAKSPRQHHIELEELKAQMRALQEKIEALEAQNQQTNQRLQDALGDDDGKAWYHNIKGKVKKGTGLTWSTADGSYKLRMRLRGQFLAEFRDFEGKDEALGFRIRRARLNFSGHAFRPWFKYKIEFDFRDAAAELKDLRFDFAYNKMFTPRVGQYKVPTLRETLTSSSALQFVDRSIVNDNFEFDRDIGFGLLGSDGKYFAYELGLYQGQGPNSSNDRGDTGMLWAGRVQFSPFGNDVKQKVNFAKHHSLAIGTYIAGINVELDDGGDPKDSNVGGFDEDFGGLTRLADLGVDEAQFITWGADINYKHPRFNIEGEYIGRWTDPDSGADSIYDQALRVQAGVFVLPKTLEVAARWAQIWLDDEVGGTDTQWEITPGINYYLSKDHRWKIQVDYSRISTDALSGGEDTDDNRVSAQFQAYF